MCDACGGRGWMPEPDGRGQEPCELCAEEEAMRAVSDAVDDLWDGIDRLIETAAAAYMTQLDMGPLLGVLVQAKALKKAMEAWDK